MRSSRSRLTTGIAARAIATLEILRVLGRLGPPSCIKLVTAAGDGLPPCPRLEQLRESTLSTHERTYRYETPAPTQQLRATPFRPAVARPVLRRRLHRLFLFPLGRRFRPRPERHQRLRCLQAHPLFGHR